MFFSLLVSILLCVQLGHLVEAGTKTKPHAHTGVLQTYDGRHIPYSITLEQNQKLEAGHPVTINERSGKNGRGIALQDIAAPPHVCLDRISDLANYHKMVPKVKKVEVYEEIKLTNGTTRVGASFDVGVSLLNFNYYLMLSHEPQYQTFTWTLDYRYHSDFEDSVGHWQVMPHPTKEGWSRVLYSCAVQLPPWVPEFVITFLTKTALVEATTWVRKESEKVVASPALYDKVQKLPFPDVRACFVADAHSARYETHCSEVHAQAQVQAQAQVGSAGSTGVVDSGATEVASVVQNVEDVDVGSSSSSGRTEL